MSVTVNAVATADTTGNGATSASHSNLTIGAISNTALAVSMCWSANVASPAMNWNASEALSQVAGATATNTASGVQRADVWGRVNPTTGNKTLSVSWTTAADFCVFAAAYDGVDQTGGSTSFAHGAGATGTSTTASVTVTSATGNMVQAAHTTGNTISAVNNTSLFRDNTPATISGAANRASGGASVSMTATLTSSQWASAGCDIVADAGGGGGTTNSIAWVTA
jgi:hypothetical protein